MQLTSVLLLVVVLAASAWITRLVRETAKRKQLLDRPNERSAHSNPTPRLGGIGIMAAFLPAFAAVALFFHGGTVAFVVLVATAAISAVGLWDDLRSLPARARLGAQTLAATAVVVSAWDRLPEAWSLFGWSIPHALVGALSVLWIVWITNLYNFMDGIDGLAAGQAVIAGCALALAGSAAGAPFVATASAALAVAALGFLAFNFPPASIFMGDVGSTAIGFFFASTPFLAEGGAVPVELVGVALALFILDATVTLLRRIARRERLSQAHRTHWYQRPLACGVRHRPITLTAYAGMLGVAGLAVRYPAASPSDRVTLLAGGIAVFAGVVALVLTLERRHAAAAQGQAQPQP
jgi:UDP-N-acetylmuramyl pentapeptide phosphotransferase/UDP-N-acetylglucosamine-1-phosphate transferase